MTNLKTIVLVAALATASQATANEKPTNVSVFHHSKTLAVSNPIKVRECRDIKVPVYETHQSSGDAGGGALLGMLLGGLLGKGATGNDDGAVIGAVIGGVVGADKGSRTKTHQETVGYTYEERCEIVTENRETYTDVYSHSTIRFKLNGQRYVLDFQR